MDWASYDPESRQTWQGYNCPKCRCEYPIYTLLMKIMRLYVT
jgi:hypothetical protein